MKEPMTQTPRLCQHHFGMDDRPCMKGCGDLCIVAEPEKVNARITQLERELAAAREKAIEDAKDAERYRWLRLNPVQCSNFADNQTYGRTKDKPELFDEAIDEAIRALSSEVSRK